MFKNILSDFGYCSLGEFGQSLLRIELAKPLIMFSVSLTFFSEACIHFLGLEFPSVAILVMLLVVELFTGIAASMKKGTKITSKRLQRFGLKIFIYFFLLVVFKTFQNQYDGKFLANIYSAIHSFIVLYVIGVYSVSVLENVSVIISGKKTEFKGLVDYISKRIGQKES